MYTIGTLNGKVIEQMFNVSRLKKSYVRTPTGVIVKHIKHYRLECAKAANTVRSKVDAAASPSIIKDIDLIDMKEVLHVPLKSIYTHLDNEEISEANTRNDNIDIAFSTNKYIWFEDAAVLLNAKHHRTSGV